MRLAQTILAAAILALSDQHEIEKRASGGGEKRVVCYYTNWSVYRPGTAKFNPQNINPYLCTHLIYAFGGLDRENGLRPYDKYQDIEQGGYAKFTGLKTYNKQLKTLLAIGGWNEGSARFSPLVADEERRKEFVRNVIKFLRQNHFDGLDLDWEYPAYRDGGKPKDKENYAQLVQELREEFERESSKTGRPRLLLTMAVPAGIEYIDKGYDIPKLNRYLDFMNILSYDYHSAFEPSVNHHSPLYSIEEDNEYNFDSQLTIDATVKHYLMKGADAEKLVLGIPTYGRSYTLFNADSTDLGSPSDGPGEQGDATREKGYLAYYEICNNINDGWTVVQPKESAMGPYAYKGNQWVGYDDEAIVRKKSQYVNERNLGGIMFWSIDNDDFRGKCHSRPYPLIEAAKEALVGKGVSNKLPSGTRGGKISKSGKSKATTRTTTTAAPQSGTSTTPEPPTTPDPGSDFVCKDEGFFPHPRDCKKYFWCLDSGPSDLGIVAHQFTCPSGLYFNKATDSCDFSRNVICKKPSSTTTTTTTTTAAPKTTKSSYGKITLPPKTTTTTTTTTTTEAPYEEEEDDEDYKEEDPQTIKQLINLIKKLGGVAELEKQLEGNSGTDSTTPAISKSLYQRVINSGTPRYQTIQRNGPSGPQNEGLPRERSSFRRDKPQYVTIRRERPSTTTEATEIVYAVEEEVEEEDVEEETPKYKTINRNRGTQSPLVSDYEKPEKPERPKYQPSERFRPKIRTEETPERSTTLKYTSILRSRAPTSEATATTSKYVVLQRQRTTNSQPDEVVTTENELNDEEEVTEHIVETTTLRPRVKVSDVVPTTVSIPTSTRVVTEIVEGATRRQRVPLSKLRHLIKDLDNSIIEQATTTETKPLTVITTTEEVKTERPILHGFNRKRPEIVITTTARTTPAFLSQRRNRLRTTTEPNDVSTRGRFVPSRTRGKTDESNKEESGPRFTPRHRPTPVKEEDSSQSTTEATNDKSTSRNRFSFRRRTTEKPDKPKDEAEDELFIRGGSRDSNVIRKPLYKPRFPNRRRSTTTEAPVEISSPSTTEITTTSEKTSTQNITIVLDGEVLKSLEDVITTNVPNDLNSITTDFPTTIIIPFSEDSSSTSSTEPIRAKESEEVSEETIKITTDGALESSSNISELINRKTATTEKTTPVEETEKYTALPFVSISEINNIVATNISSTSIPSTVPEDLRKLTSRFNHGRNFINSQESTNNPSKDGDKELEEPDKNTRKKIILRRRKPTTESNSIADIPDNDYKRNRTNVIKRKRPLYTENNTPRNKIVQEEISNEESPRKIQRGKVKFSNNIQKDDRAVYEDSLAQSSKDNSRTRSRITSRINLKPNITTTTEAPTKLKRIIIRGKKKFNVNNTNQNTTQIDDISKVENGKKEIRTLRRYVSQPLRNQSINLSENNLDKPNNSPKQRNKIRKVVLRKPVKDLAVEESMSPSKGGSFDSPILKANKSNKETNSLSNGDLDIDFSEDIIHTSNGEHEIQTRRPFRKTVVRSTTTTTTEAPTTPRQRTTVHSLRQRLNRFKTERQFPKASTAQVVKEAETKEATAVADFEPTTVRPTRKEFRRLIRPLHVDDSQLDASHDISSKNPPLNEIRVSQKPHKQYLEQVTEGSQLSEEYTDEEPLVLPDLANVAVAAIQSLATSPPPPSTEHYKVPVTQKITRPPKVVHRRPHTQRPTSSPIPARSSPRPFSKITYDDYEDYYAEPVEVPLSGKVRIHNDGYIECLDIGNFPHPFSCRKFISCAKMENSHLLGWEYTCPKGLSFDPIGGICNWNAGLGCKE